MNGKYPYCSSKEQMLKFFFHLYAHMPSSYATTIPEIPKRWAKKHGVCLCVCVCTVLSTAKPHALDLLEKTRNEVGERSYEAYDRDVNVLVSVYTRILVFAYECMYEFLKKSNWKKTNTMKLNVLHKECVNVRMKEREKKLYLKEFPPCWKIIYIQICTKFLETYSIMMKNQIIKQHFYK